MLKHRQIDDQQTHTPDTSKVGKIVDTPASISITRSGPISTIILNSTGNGNALDLRLYRDLEAALGQLSVDPETKAIVVEGSGADFCAGIDFDYLQGLQKDDNLVQWRDGYTGFVRSVWNNPKIVIAKVRGRAHGIGCELALLADMTFCDETATFGHPEAKWGWVEPTIWPWLAGVKVSKEYLATGALMKAAEAERNGLVNEVLPVADLDKHVTDLVTDLAVMPEGTVEANKKRINWPYRDVSRVLEDDRYYEVSFDWVRNSREVDYGFYKRVAELGFTEAVRLRDNEFAE
ncbi:MAG: enoyl-CoA hydratase/isomerase family protein [Subtercola sp.]|nr:enoyl-CoA hydratase/isomerase family protein [Subtercola sp.]